MANKFSTSSISRTGFEEFEKTLVDPKQKELYASLILANITRDPLSHVLNRQVFLERFINEYQRASNDYYKDGFAFVLIAIREFEIICEMSAKTINDVLGSTGKLLKHSFRNKDILGRFADDSFSIVLTEISKDTAIARTKDFIHAFAKKEMSGLYFSISAGMAYFDGKNFTSPFHIIEKAEEKLNKARHRDDLQEPLF
jgi:diguanylate cyclase (GGDEF)-like protein